MNHQKNTQEFSKNTTWKQFWLSEGFLAVVIIASGIFPELGCVLGHGGVGCLPASVPQVWGLQEWLGTCPGAPPWASSWGQSTSHLCTSSQEASHQANQLGKLKRRHIHLHIFIYPQPGPLIQRFSCKSFLGLFRMTGQDENNFEPNEQLLKVTTIILPRY